MVFAPAPTGWLHTLDLRPPSLSDNTADVDRLANALKKALGSDKITINLELARQLPRRLRQNHYRAPCIVFKSGRCWHLVELLDADHATAAMGLAIDLGTSRVVLRLVGLSDGAILAESAFDNPQIEVGPDVLTRLHHCDRSGGRDQLHRLIIDGLNSAIETLCRDHGVAPQQIYLLALAGNTAMTHLFLNLEVHHLFREPYIPALNRPGLQRAAELGLAVNCRARICVFPNVGSYFGGDLIAGILFSGLHRHSGEAILVDVGTNAEVVLGNKEWLVACAGAAGPALEGGVTRMGMMAGPGVIDRVEIDPQSGAIAWHAIGDQVPVGICGSGLIDLAAQLFRAGMLDIRGRLVPERCGDCFETIREVAHFRVVPANESASGKALMLSQVAIDSLVRSKAAMYTILETITQHVGIALEQLQTFFVAGTFGSFISPASAVTIGMLPDLPLSHYRTLGNSSLGGTTMVLQSAACVDEIDHIRDTITYLELNVNQDFMNRFSAAKFIPHTDRARFPSVGPSSPAG
jgi:uncharacterized 2Fe-2S/4Fe-4S cluster protein (DUF4445 family)